MRVDKTARRWRCVIAILTVVACAAYAQAALGCTPVVNRTAKQVAPHLQLVGSVAGAGNCPAIRVADSSANGSVIWGIDWSGGLWRSTDDLASWTRTYQLPLTYKRIMNVLQLRSGHILIHVMDNTGAESILRSTDTAGAAFSKVPSLLFPPGETIHGSPSWTEAGGAVYAAGYGDRLDPVTLWKSFDDGVTFAPVFQLAGYLSNSLDPVRHFHDVFADPYNSRRIWLTVGDHPGSRIGYSDNGGITFTWITRSTYPQSRAVGLFFTPSAVYWGTDAPETSDEV